MFNAIAKLDVSTHEDTRALILYDYQHQRQEEWPEFAGYQVLDIANNGALLVVARPCVQRGASKKEVLVVSRPERNIAFATSKYYVYDAKLDTNAQKLLVVAQGKKPFCLDLPSQQIIGEMPATIRTFRGDAHLPTNTFYAPSELKKNKLYLLDFDTGSTTEATLPVNAIITRLRFSRDQQFLYCVTQSNVLWCFDSKLNFRWQTDCKPFGKKDGNISAAGIFQSEDGSLLCLPISATEHNNWGEEYVFDATTGELLRRLANYPRRGRVAADFFGAEVLLHGGHTLNLESGHVSGPPAW